MFGNDGHDLRIFEESFEFTKVELKVTKGDDVLGWTVDDLFEKMLSF